MLPRNFLKWHKLFMTERKKKQILPYRKDLFLLDQDAYFTRRDSFAFSSASTMAGINTAWMSAPGAVEVK